MRFSSRAERRPVLPFILFLSLPSCLRAYASSHVEEDAGPRKAAEATADAKMAKAQGHAMLGVVEAKSQELASALPVSVQTAKTAGFGPETGVPIPVPADVRLIVPVQTASAIPSKETGLLIPVPRASSRLPMPVPRVSAGFLPDPELE